MRKKGRCVMKMSVADVVLATGISVFVGTCVFTGFMACSQLTRGAQTAVAIDTIERTVECQQLAQECIEAFKGIVDVGEPRHAVGIATDCLERWEVAKCSELLKEYRARLGG